MTDPAAGHTDAAGPQAASASLVIALLVGSAFVMILNETIMSVALPALIADLDITVSTAQWLTSGFLLTMAVVIPITGFLLQRFPPRRVYLVSMLLFTAGTLVSALAPGFPVLLAGRIVQAAGTAVMVPLLMTTVLRLVPVERRGATMGTITIVIAVAPAVGPTLSGVILSTLGWRFMFWVVLPVGLVALTVFVARQLRLQGDGNALLDLRPFGHRPFVLAMVLVVLSMMALFGVLILLPLYLQDVLRVSAFVTGLAVLPGGLAMGLLGPVVGRLYDRLGPRRLVIPGAVVLTGALWAFTTLGGGSPFWT